MLTKTRRSDLGIPFDSEQLDRLLDEAGIDVLLATAKHNVQYLLGGHRSLFFETMDASGLSRYLPVVIYPKGEPDKAAYLGHRLEHFQKEVKPFWTPEAHTSTFGTLDAAAQAADYVRRLGGKRIGVETPFLPMDAADALREHLPDAEFIDATPVLDRLRAVKTKEELAMLRYASEQVIEAMMAVVASHGPGTTKHELVEALRREETDRGLGFDYCLLTVGTEFNRAASDKRWQEGDIMSLDSGGNYRGYIGDVTRMAILGEPDAELVDLLGEVETIQQAVFRSIKAGAPGRTIYATAEAAIARTPLREHIDFLAHGMGLVTHEVPHLAARGFGPDPSDAEPPLQAGYVVSVETTLHHPRRGFIKLEDTVIVTDSGYEIYGDGARGWNRGGTAVR